MTSPVVKTYADRLYRCNVTASTPGEQIVNTIWMQKDPASLDSKGTQDIADRVRDVWTSLITGGLRNSVPAQAALFAATTQWTTVDVYKVDAAGRATEQASATFAPTVKGSGTGALAPQLSLVATLLTAVPGRSGRGRMYLGGLSNSLSGADGRLAANNAAAIASAWAQMYADLRHDAADPDDFRPVVASPTKGTANAITKVQVGDVFDTMRSRRANLVEARSTANVP